MFIGQTGYEKFISWQRRLKKIENLFSHSSEVKVRQNNVKVGSVIDNHGQVVSDANEKVELLNDFFWSVFTKENNTEFPAPDNCFDEDQEDRLLDIVIEPETIEAKLRNLKPDKAAGDDNMSPRLLKSISGEIALPVKPG